MATLELRPLTQETIDEMGFQKHDLWLVKIQDDLFGPFETESLKHYASENQSQFDHALASRSDEIDYRPFWTHPLLQRRSPQVIKSEAAVGPFWLLEEGLKQGPLSFEDIDKKIEMNVLGMTDHISDDDGHTWKKIFEIEAFNRRAHTSEELPVLPTEELFHKGKLSLVEKMDHPHEDTADQLASLAHVGTHEAAKVIQFKVEEMSLQVNHSTEVSSSLKWAVPSAAALVVALVSTGYFMFNKNDETSPLISEAETQEHFFQAKSNPQKVNNSPRGYVPEVTRAPASTNYARPSQDSEEASRYPTHIETHDQPMDEVSERDFDQSPGDADQQRPEEHSLVSSAPEEHSLDAAMNGVNQPTEQPLEPVVDEAGDF